jgi:hypothetical protein
MGMKLDSPSGRGRVKPDAPLWSIWPDPLKGANKFTIYLPFPLLAPSLPRVELTVDPPIKVYVSFLPINY